MDNVLTAIFEVESQGYQAFTEVKKDLANARYLVPQMALVKKHNGIIETLDQHQSEYLINSQMFGGGLFGSLLGVLGGPIGMLLGGTTGALVGAAGDEINMAASASLLENVCGKLGEGSVAIVALVSEEHEGALDSVLTKFDAVIMRRDIAFVAEEVAEAERLEAEMRNQAFEQLKAHKKAELSANIQQTKEKIKADIEAFKERIKKA